MSPACHCVFDSSVSSARNPFPLSPVLPTCPAIESWGGMEGYKELHETTLTPSLLEALLDAFLACGPSKNRGFLSMASWVSQLSAWFLCRRGSWKDLEAMGEEKGSLGTL